MLGVDGATGSKGRVELYEKGYGKDAAGIAKEAIAYGASRLQPPSSAFSHTPNPRTYALYLSVFRFPP